MAEYYYLDADGQSVRGPFSRVYLRHELSRGRLPHSCWCWHEGMTDWEPLEQVLHRPEPNATPIPFSREFLTELRDDLQRDIDARRADPRT